MATIFRGVIAAFGVCMRRGVVLAAIALIVGTWPMAAPSSAYSSAKRLNDKTKVDPSTGDRTERKNSSPNTDGGSESSSTVRLILAYGAGWVSAGIAAVVLLVSLRRRPKIVAYDGEELEGPEWIGVHAVIGRRPLEVHEIGLVFSWGPVWSRGRYWHPGPTRTDLPARLQDGALVATGFELEGLIEDVSRRISEETRKIAISQPYVEASGKKYRGWTMASGPLNRFKAIFDSL